MYDRRNILAAPRLAGERKTCYLVLGRGGSPTANLSIMPKRILTALTGLFAILLIFGCGEKKPAEGDFLSVLVFSKTAGFRHSSIEDGHQMFRDLAERYDFEVTITEDASVFDPLTLANYNVIVFLSTTGDVLDPQQQRALEGFMQAGGGWMGIHAAADTEYNWPWYNELVGAYFNGHPNNPNVRQATIIVDDREHPATAHLGETWERSDEWYNYKDIVKFHRLMRMDETSYEGGTNGENHPISWCNEFENGRMFYTGLGHTSETYVEESFVQHVWGGIQYVAGPKQRLDFSVVNFAPEENRFVTEELVTGMFEPMELELLPDGRPIWIQRRGEIMMYLPEVDVKAQVNQLDVWTKFEDGLMGLALDPNFTEEPWMYFYYSPNVEESINRLSRFRWTGDDIDKSSEQIILEVPTDRNECCHSGGSIEFGPEGHLFLSVGDNTNPFDSEGFAPIDDSKELGNWDARRSAGNTMDLRGKILRIKVNADGSYSTPPDNLFPDGEGGRPEIFVMGCRNPFRISIDQNSGVLYWGDVGPDAGRDSTEFGPKGHCEVNYAPTAGNYGWPLFIADNQPYRRRDFTSDTGGEFFDPAAPVNESRFNTGSKTLPPARPAMVYYPYGPSEVFPQVGEGGRNPMAGPVYHLADYGDSEVKFPEYYDGKFFFYEWMRNWIMAAELDENGKVTRFERFLPDLELSNPMDVSFAADGSLYILEYGKKWFKENEDARLLRVSFNGGNRAPVVAMNLATGIGAAPLELVADLGDSEDYDGDELTATWLLNGNQIHQGHDLRHSVEQAGVHELTLRLDDGEGEVVEQSRRVIVGNSLPRVDLGLRGNRSFFFADQPLEYRVSVTDLEDGNIEAGIDPAAVTVSLDYVEGEDLIEMEYGHQVATASTELAMGKKLIGKSDCASCHQAKEKSIGPSYLAIAKRYRTDEKAIDYLAGKIIKGGGGVWGEQAMAAHPQLTENEAAQMAEYILSLAESKADEKPSLPIAGQQPLRAHRAGIPGRYYLQASYTDRGGAGDIPRLTVRERAVLRSPVLPAHRFEDGKKVMSYSVPAADNPLSDEDMDVLVASNGGWAYYGDLDLNSIGSVEALILLAPNLTSGGTVEVVADDPVNGPMLGSAHISQGLTTYGENELKIELDTTTFGGKDRPVYFRFKADDDGDILGAVLSFTFQRDGQLSK